MHFLAFMGLTLALISIPAIAAGIIVHLDTWGR